MATEPQIWEKKGDEKRTAVKAMFENIAPGYDRLNRLMSLNLDRSWRRTAVSMLKLSEQDSALDLCCGTGDFMVELRKVVGPNALVLGLDFALPMLTQSQEKDSAFLGQADAGSLPMRDAVVEAVTVGWGIRNVPDIDLAHREIFRVLKPGGRFVSLDMAVPTNPFIRTAASFVTLKVLPKLGKKSGYSEAYAYLPESTMRFWDREKLKDSMEEAGFTDVQYRNFFFGNICLHYGKKP